MPTRKQRRRRAKEQRHEYEVVYVDDEGNEVEAETDEKLRPKERAQKRSSGDTQGRARGRGVDPPSWRKTFRRALIFAPVFFGTVLLIMPSREIAGAVAQTLLLLVIFVPFSYFMDRVFWRSYQKRLARSSGR